MWVAACWDGGKLDAEELRAALQGGGDGAGQGGVMGLKVAGVGDGAVAGDELERAEPVRGRHPRRPAHPGGLDAKLASLAEVIDAHRPDVLALQEVGPPEVLAQLQQRLTHQLPHRELSAHPDRRGIRVAICSHLPLHQPLQLHRFPAGLAPVQVGDPPPAQASRRRPRTTWAAAPSRSPSPPTARTSRS
jgi:hypothetical protein